ncbi:hypothetical protein ACTA71_005973 [Dictyostelium dimigraforme]
MRIVYIGKSREKVSSRLNNNKSKIFKYLEGGNAISCYMRFDGNDGTRTRDYNTDVDLIEQVLLGRFATLVNEENEFNPGIDTLVYGTNHLPVDILRSFLNMDISNPLAPFGIIDGQAPLLGVVNHMLDVSKESPKTGSENTSFCFPEGVPYAGGRVLDGDYSQFDLKECNKTKNNSNEPKITVKFKSHSSSYLKLVNSRIGSQLLKLGINTGEAPIPQKSKEPEKGGVPIWKRASNWFGEKTQKVVAAIGGGMAILEIIEIAKEAKAATAAAQEVKSAATATVQEANVVEPAPEVANVVEPVPEVANVVEPAPKVANVKPEYRIEVSRGSGTGSGSGSGTGSRTVTSGPQTGGTGRVGNRPYDPNLGREETVTRPPGV